MFLFSLTVAAFQLLCAAGVFALASTRTAWGVTIAVLSGCFATLVLPMALFSPVSFLQAGCLVAIAIACICLKARNAVFIGWSVAATVAVIGGLGWMGPTSWSGLRERYPFESISNRLAYETAAAHRQSAVLKAAGLPAPPTLSEASEERLIQAEQIQGDWMRVRREALRLVHASQVEQFVESPGFGVGRMLRPSPSSIEYVDQRAKAVYPFDRRPDLTGSPEPAAAATRLGVAFLGSSAAFDGPLGEMHDRSRADFLDPGAFGYVRDRDHVAGFVSHGFLNGLPYLRASQSAGRRWLTVRVELVSILKHDRPMVYVSEHLPKMNELREAPARELDAFERQALPKLLDGDDLVSETEAGRIRAAGPLRAAKQCLECHEVRRGSLLGAFSYEFLRDPPPERPHDAPPAKTDEEKLL